jgi:ATP-dependent DNA helicase RecQ
VKSSYRIEYNKELFEQLRILRKTMADKADVPPFVVFSDKALMEMAAVMPTDTQEFLSIHGVGAHKLDKYGTDFMEEIKAFKSTHSFFSE